MFGRLRKWVKLVKKDALTLWFACRDPRTPLRFKLMATGLAAYAFSPIDLIPDVIPVVGLLDDAVIVPFGMMLLLRLLPAAIRNSSRSRAELQRARGKKVFSGLGVLLLVWIALIIYLIYRHSA
ncbi:YkvA family protein [Erwinia sp. P7711]|uniref:YkvA family protein n=1 Tax=Erwinia sp. P7711 TaxID=3141451 RepID=UPI00318FC167